MPRTDDEARRKGRPGVLAALLLAVLFSVPPLAVLIASDTAHAASFPNAKWKAEEDRCIAACPPFPRFSGTETDAQYQRRIKAENAYNRCYAKCTKQYEDRVRLPYKPYDDGSQGYLKRNR